VGKPIQVLEEARDSVSSVDVRGHEVATGSVDGRLRLYDLRMGMVSVDVMGRRWRGPGLPPWWVRPADWLPQSPSRPSSKRATGRRRWCRRWTRPSG
jgi:hypothetical protein